MRLTRDADPHILAPHNISAFIFHCDDVGRKHLVLCTSSLSVETKTFTIDDVEMSAFYQQKQLTPLKI
jgi:hypothetical protein